MPLVIPNAIVNGAALDASKVEANFAAVSTFVNTLPEVASATYTPTLTNLAIGTGGLAANTARYTFVGGPSVGARGLLVASGEIAFGTTGATLPAALTERIRLPAGFAWAAAGRGVGVATFSVTGQRYEGSLAIFDGTDAEIILADTNAAVGYIRAASLTAALPAVWAAGDTITWSMSAQALRI